MNATASILLIRLKSIGDVVFTLPAANVVRDNFPDARITFLTSKENEPMLQGFPAVTNTIALDRARFQSGNPKAFLGEVFSLLRRLRSGKFSLVIDFQGYGETEWLAWWSGAPQRWGSVYRAARGWTYSRGVRRNSRIHPVRWNLSFLAQCGLKIGEVKNEFVLPEDALAAARRFYSDQKLDVAKPVIFIQPFSSSPQKNWPLQNYLAVARHWRARGVQILFGGGPTDRPALEPARAEGFGIAAGQPLLVSLGLAKLATFMLGGDTGLGHLAVAAGQRVVMVMMGNQFGFCVPFQHPEWAVVPAQGTDITTISLADVLAATTRAFNESTGNASC